jgi:phosphoglycerate dehydrogenase-like enzyme
VVTLGAEWSVAYLGRVITVCVPSEEARTGIGEVDGARIVVWDGSGAPPEDAREAVLLLDRYMADPWPLTALEALPQLRVVQLLSAGVDRWLPRLAELRASGRDITLCNGRGVHGPSTAAIAVAGLLALVRELPFFVREQAASRWTPEQSDGVDGKNLLVLGAGDIGSRIAASLEALGATPTLVARTARDGVHGIDELPALLPTAHLLAIALPLTDETRGLVDAKFLAALPDGAVLSNIARGPIVDTDALVAECRAGRLRAHLDVTDPEPLPQDHPLWTAPGVLITPHVGGGTTGWVDRGFALVRAQIERIVAGDPLVNVVGERY